MDLIEHNRRAWNKLAREGILWSRPVSSETIANARSGEWSVSLAGRDVPRTWLGELRGRDVLCLASGGGQQAPVLAAAGATVTSMDLSDVQLERDRMVAERDGLLIRTEQGTMSDLSRFDSESFDLIFMPVSVNAVPDIAPVWRECYRVLRTEGCLLAGFINPLVYLFEENDGSSPDMGLVVVHSLPFSEIDALDADARRATLENGSPFLWSHTLEDLLGGQLAAGFVFTHFQEGYREDERAPNISRFAATYFATRALKCPPSGRPR
jgi:2-polyprenyl-3-methyl-5-hydroxy-6-metoxy-1,4-benzoquinol methylase